MHVRGRERRTSVLLLTCVVVERSCVLGRDLNIDEFLAEVG